MFFWLLFLFIVVPLAELWVISQVWGAIGGVETIALLLIDSVIGAMLVKHQGVGILDRIQRRLAAGTMPTDDLIDGAMVLFAGALMLTPGFITDGFGLLLLLPPSRAVLRRLVGRRFKDRIATATVTGGSAGFRPGFRTTSGAAAGFDPTRWDDGTIDLDDDAVVEDRLVEDLRLEDRGGSDDSSGPPQADRP